VKFLFPAWIPILHQKRSNPSYSWEYVARVSSGACEAYDRSLKLPLSHRKFDREAYCSMSSIKFSSTAVISNSCKAGIGFPGIGRVKTRFLLPLICFLTFLNSFSYSSPCEINALIHDMQKRYQSMQTLEAKFTQTAFRHNIMGHLEKLVQKGELRIKKPGMLRWDYTHPEKRLYISNGKTLWIYSPEDKQVIQRRWNSKEVALQFLLGMGNISRDFDYRLLKTEEKKNFSTAKGNWIYLTPKKERVDDFGPLEALILNINPKTQLVSDAWIIDPIGTKTHWQFERIRLDKGISDKTFQFQIPKNVQVLYY